jgi:hypothetical protein
VADWQQETRSLFSSSLCSLLKLRRDSCCESILTSQYTSAERTASVAKLVVDIARTAAASFGKALTQKSAGSPESVIPKITLEVCSLYVHLLDRTVFSSLSAEQRELANRNLIEALAREWAPTHPDEIFSVLVELFRNDSDYPKFVELLPRPGSSARDTLFWEFGKNMGFKYQGYNPIALQVFILAVADGYIRIVKTIDELSRL